MKLRFTKMQAQGNDFVILDGRHQTLPEPTPALMMRLADRRTGIGCDQVLMLSPDPSADARMRIFNPDGGEAGNCGNGLRCVGDLLLRELGKDSARIALADRTVTACRSESGIRVEMGAARITGETTAHVDVELGNPHRVFFEAVEDFPTDRNIEIITGRVGPHAYIDIIERGAGRTPACGSGACAVAAAIWHVEGAAEPVTVCMPGGDVTVSGDAEHLLLEGPVAHVFDGEIELS
ncbi:MAG TPA: diaminopimelate epimerase [Mariprofundaceae bacterium]|nr:diaminopimelate epimerase [Mariprofundaceae bacterium]